MKGQNGHPKFATAVALASALAFSPLGVATASANSPASVNSGAIDVHYHRIHDHRGGVPLIAGLALGLIGAAEAAESYPYYYSPPSHYGPHYYGGPYVGSYYYPESRIYPPG